MSVALALGRLRDWGFNMLDRQLLDLLLRYR